LREGHNKLRDEFYGAETTTSSSAIGNVLYWTSASELAKENKKAIKLIESMLKSQGYELQLESTEPAKWVKKSNHEEHVHAHLDACDKMGICPTCKQELKKGKK